MLSVSFLRHQLSRLTTKPLTWITLYHLCLMVLTLYIYWLSTAYPSLSNFFTHFQNWDAANFLYVAQHGYVSQGDQLNFIVLFPLLPMLLHLGMMIGLSPVAAGLLVSIPASIAGQWFLWKLLRERGASTQTTWKVLGLWWVSPIAIYFSMVYSESLFFLCFTAFFYYLYRKNWWVAGILAALATLTRVFGIFCVVPYALAWFYSEDRSWRTLKPIVLSGLAFLLYLGINWWVFDAPFYFLYIQKTHWSKELVFPVAPILNAVGLIRAWNFQYPSIAVDHIVTLVAPLIFAVYVYVKRAKGKLTPGELLWTGMQLLLLLSQSWWLCNARYTLVMWPLFVMIVSLTKRLGLWSYIAVFCVFVLLSLYSLQQFASGGWLY